MKTEEDEAFDDLAKKQGDWGGGFKAKQAMAADKLHWNEDEWRRNNWRCGHGWLRGEQCESCNAPQPPSEWAGIKAILDEYGLQAIDFVADFKAALAQPAQEREWVGLTTDEMKEIADRYHLKPPNIPVAFRALEAKLKEKNNGL